MKNRFPGVVAALIALTATADDLKLEELPQPVQATIKQKVGSNKIQDIDRENRNGQVVFEVEYEDAGGLEQQLLISKDGKLIEEWRDQR